MPRELARVSYEEFAGHLETWLNRVARDNLSLVVETSEGVGIVLRPLPEGRPVRRRGTPRGKALTRDDPLWTLVGVGRSGLKDVSENTDRYLAEAYLNRPNNP